jgi:hypothetical protein
MTYHITVTFTPTNGGIFRAVARHDDSIHGRATCTSSARVAANAVIAKTCDLQAAANIREISEAEAHTIPWLKARLSRLKTKHKVHHYVCVYLH